MFTRLSSPLLIICRLFVSLTLLMIVGSFVAASGVLAETVTSPQTCRVGVYVASLRDLNLAEKRFSSDFYLWSVCPSEELQPLKSMKILNVEDFDRFKASNNSTSERKDLPKWFYPKEVVYWSGRKIRATLYQSWNVSNFPSIATHWRSRLRRQPKVPRSSFTRSTSRIRDTNQTWIWTVGKLPASKS